MKKIKIRQGKQEDLAEIAQIQEGLYKQIYETPDMKRIQQELNIKSLLDQVNIEYKIADSLIIAETHEIVGYAFCMEMPCTYIVGERVGGQTYLCQKRRKYCREALHIVDIGAKKGFQRKGVGTKLLEEIVKEAKSKKRKKIFLQSWLGSPGNSSYKFFKKHGFEEQVHIKNHPQYEGGVKIMCLIFT